MEKSIRIFVIPRNEESPQETPQSKVNNLCHPEERVMTKIVVIGSKKALITPIPFSKI